MSKRQRYDFDRLNKYCDENCVLLLEDYSDKYLDKNVIIKGRCVYENCENIFEKVFRELSNTGAYCKPCSKIVANDRRRKTCLEKYGIDNITKRIEYKEKIKSYNLEKYGVEYTFQSEIIKNKIKEVNISKYGVSNPMQNNTIKKKVKKTCLEKYGVENVFKNETIREKCNDTIIQKYGVINPSQNEEIKNKKVETSLRNWGVEHPFQNPEIMEKNVKSSYSKKEYVFPSGKIEKIQGYEHFALDELIIVEKINESDIIIGCKNVPEIWYSDENGKKHRYYVDIFISSQNRCIEVKSEWTYNIEINNVLLKKEATKKLGYNYEFWVYDRKGNKNSYY